MILDIFRPSTMLTVLKPTFLSAILILQSAPHPEALPMHLRYERALQLPSSTTVATHQGCAVIDSQVFTHAAPSLKDLRLYAGSTEAGRPELPYAITLSEPLQQDSEEARILNLGTRAGHIVFDLEMPHRPYTSVSLDIEAQDYIATAEVSGAQTIGAPSPTRLGTFTLFDLSSQHLSRSTNLPLAESSFAYLHIELTLTPAAGTTASVSSLNRPEILKSANIPPSREAQIVYTTIQQSGPLIQRGRESIATFQLPVRVPIERIAFTLAPSYKGSFSRSVRITAHAKLGEKADAPAGTESAVEDRTELATEGAAGTILSVHKLEAGREISYESLALPAAIGSNMQRSATLEVAVDNGDDTPLPIVSVQLQMRQRRICFDAASGTNPPLTLFYGDPALEAPVYDYAKLFQPSATPLVVSMDEETANPTYTPRTDARPFTERHPELLWIVLLAVVCVLALTAFRSAKKLPR